MSYGVTRSAMLMYLLPQVQHTQQQFVADDRCLQALYFIKATPTTTQTQIAWSSSVYAMMPSQTLSHKLQPLADHIR